MRRRTQLGALAVQQLTTKGPTLDEWIAQRWTPEHGTTLAPSTLKVYAGQYALHVRPWLGDRPLRELTVSVLRQWQAERLAAGVGAGALDKARVHLSSVLRHAAESEAIPSNPLALLRRPRPAPKDEVGPLAPAAIEAMRATLEHRDATLLSVLGYAGLRPGEALTLRWGHVADRTLVVNASKTGQRRSVRLLAPLVADLRAWREACPDGRDAALVFPGADGKEWTKEAYKSWARRPSTVKRKGEGRLQRTAGPFGRACMAAGVEHATPYTLRHSFASLLLAEGRNVIYVARQLGHSATMTLTTYGHVLAEYEDAGRIDPEREIQRARLTAVPLSGHSGAA